MNIDHVLNQYEPYFTYHEQRNRIGKVSKQVTDDRYVRLLAGLGTYCLKKDRFVEGLEFVLDSLRFSIEISMDEVCLEVSDCLSNTGNMHLRRLNSNTK